MSLWIQKRAALSTPERERPHDEVQLEASARLEIQQQTKVVQHVYKPTQTQACTKIQLRVDRLLPGKWLRKEDLHVPHNQQTSTRDKGSPNTRTDGTRRP